MPNYDEKAYRMTRSKDGPTLAEQKSQLARLKQDLEQFTSRQAGGAILGSLKERIRDLEGSIARIENARALDREARRTGEDGGPGNPVRATSSRFPPRGTPGRG
ncbi:MAG TPA: Gas vesicle protein V [Azospirillum sp.]|nr:Gas vesicle protein V [Azospirillum sp.]